MRIAEIFQSIQGEGALAGMPAVFVRVAGCNLQCDWCDTRYAWDAAAGQAMSVAQVVEQVGKHSACHCVLTGGEPMVADGIAELSEALDAAGCHITIESNATVPPGGIKCHLASLSPKLGHSGSDQEPPMERQIEVVREWAGHYDCQLKFVVEDGSQIEVIRAFVDRLEGAVPADRLFLMPRGADAESVAGRAALVSGLCMQYGFRYGPRLHLQMYGNRRGT